MNKLFYSIAFLLILFFGFQTPAFSDDSTKAGTRWWWLGSAVDTVNLAYNLQEYDRVGIGSVEITPIYGVQNNDVNNIVFLSPEWMKMLSFTIAETKRLGMETDMNTGTGWPFGGPEVTVRDAASKLLIREYEVNGKLAFSEKIIPDDKRQQKDAVLQRLMAYSGKRVLDLTKFVDNEGNINWKAPKGSWKLVAAFNGKTFQQVKRAAPGGEGLVMDHFSASAVDKYLAHFEKAFSTSGSPYPHAFFNDSYEVYGADWTEDFFEQFERRRGYKLELHLPAFLAKERSDLTVRLVADYRETISDLLLENFTRKWTDWAHSHGSITRNQAHGSPGNLIDLYATVDIPEIEGFGLSDFGIKGLRRDSLTRKNDADFSMLKYASSAAHISGKKLISSETFTWLTEHFRTSLSQCKPDLDLMFVAGVNRMNFHGTTYSPREAAWPGWKFYASIDMSPTNTIWRDAPAMLQYIERCQSLLRPGKPDNDFLLYLPVYDVWHDQEGRLLQFDIHSMEKRMPAFIHAVQSIYQNGYDVDYSSDSFVLSARCENGKIVTKGGASYKALILPAVRKMPVEVLQHISALATQGATIVFLENTPNDVPGLKDLKQRRKSLKKVLKNIKTDFTKVTVSQYKNGRFISGTDYNETLKAIGTASEEMISTYGLHAIRRANADGHLYFISALHEKDTRDWISLAGNAVSAEFFDPMTGKGGKAAVRQQNGRTQVMVNLKSGQSVFLKTFTEKQSDLADWNYPSLKQKRVALNNVWKMYFLQSEPEVKDTFTLVNLHSWTELEHPTLKINTGTAAYETTFEFNASDLNKQVYLHLGDVRESARVFLNGKETGVVWAAPYDIDLSGLLLAGKNELRIEVTNLPANRIADYDRRGINWKIFNEINIVNIGYKPPYYANWETVSGGLCSEVSLSIGE